MTPDLGCYGDDIRRLAELTGDFELRSAMDVMLERDPNVVVFG